MMLLIYRKIKGMMLLIYRKIKVIIFSFLIRRKTESCGVGLRVNHHSKISGIVYLGNNVNFNGMIISGGGKVIIGDNFHSGQDCLMITQNHNYEGNEIPYDSSYINKDINIGDNVWLGSRIIILGGVTIGEGAIIQAGSVVVNDIPKYSIAGGHPARVFNQRDIKHYELLKQKRKFH